MLDLTTDCVSCVFEKEFPFKCDDNNNIVGYYYDENYKCPRYELEQKEEGHRLKVERMPRYCRTDKYEYIKPIGWTLLKDVDDNNFQPLIDNIIKNKLSVNIDGRAGTGKSTFINQLVENFEKNNISFKTLAYTNKAARIINGSTIHKFIKTISGSKALKELQYEYIIVDEISMIPEMFYKFFCIIKRLKPDIKFIIAGEFLQLQPVNDRIGTNIDYKNSYCLYELVDGNRIQLTKCRRSDDTFFNMLLPENIDKINSNTFSNKFTDRHITFTNKRRIEVNQIMMDKRTKNTKYLKLQKLKYDDHSQNVKLIPDTPIIARKK